MITADIILSRLQVGEPGEDVSITLSALCKLLPEESPAELVLFICDIDGVQITNSDDGGIIIPARYFRKK